MLQAFIDDSGNDGKSPVFVLAGYISTTEKWDAFSHEWRKLLNPEVGKSLGVLKMKEVYRNRIRGSQYYGWSDTECDERLISLVKTINRHAMHGIISVIPFEPYHRLIKGKFNPDALDRLYFLSFFGIMSLLLNLTRQLKLGNQVSFIFDSQDSENKSSLMAEFDRFISLAPSEIQALSAGRPQFKRDEEFAPLQAADMMAWHARRYYFDLFSGKEPTQEPSNVYFANLLLPKHDIIDIWDEERIRQVSEVLSQRRGSKAPVFGEGISMTLPDPTSRFVF